MNGLASRPGSRVVKKMPRRIPVSLLSVLAGPLLAGATPAGDECADWPAEARPAQQIVVIVDATDGLSRPQRDDLWSRIRPLADRAPAGSALHIHEIRDGAESGFRLVASVRRPPHWCEVGFFGDNPKLRKKQWRSRYLRPLRRALARAARAGPSGSSAILQGVQAAARHFDGGGTGSAERDPENHLVLVSDLMQNDGADFYRRVPSFADFSGTRLYRELRTRHLRGARLTVLRLPTRGRGVDPEALRHFWTEYFESQGMRRVRSGFLDLEGPSAVAPTN